MDATNSDLSSSKYGYDFVISTTQASINSGLWEYLAGCMQPETYLCLQTDDMGNPTIQISLADLMAKTGGVNPFIVPDGTPTSDPRIQTLTKNSFAVGIKIQMGIPPGVLPTDLPPVLELGDSADSVLFRMYCAEFQIIQNNPNPWGDPGSWKVWTQPSGTPWYAETHVNLAVDGIDPGLDTPYFDQRQDQKFQIQRRLMNLSDPDITLQQLYLDLKNGDTQTPPIMKGLPDEILATGIVVEEHFVNVYNTAAQGNGPPLLALTAMKTGNFVPSQLEITSSEPQVSVYKDANGLPKEQPTAAQISVTTLDHLCMIHNDANPGANVFPWNWVQPEDVDQESGVIAINRQVFSQYLLDTIMPVIKSTCFTSNVYVVAENGVGKWTQSFVLIPGQTPQTSSVTEPGSGNEVINVAWSAEDQPGVRGRSSYDAFYIELDVIPNYTCTVSVSGNTITITQRLWFRINVFWDGTGEGINGWDKTITDVYNISVDQNGVVQIAIDLSQSRHQDNSQTPNGNWLENIIISQNEAVDEIRSQINDIVSLDLSPVDFTKFQDFVFPCANVFAYSSATFSKNQDLICNITYTDPSPSYQPTTMAQVPVTEPLPANASLSEPTSNLKTSPTSFTMSHTSDMIQNYLQGEVVSPTSKFEALQTNDGHSMLFAMDASNVLAVIHEQSGTVCTGWGRMDLSSALLTANFSNDPNAAVQTFDVGQSAIDGTIGMAVAISSGGSDNLFLSLYNSNSDTSWTAKPGWISVPFDATNANATSQTISVVGIMLAETMNNQQYIVVDVDRSSTSSVKDIARYYVDPLKASGTFWTEHDVSVDIQDGNYQSCVGRKRNGFVDGIYTSGTVGGSAQLVYTPIKNVFGGGPALPSRLNLPGGVQASAIAASRIVDPSSDLNGSTDLYAISGSILYWFAAANQGDGAIGTPLLNNVVFAGTSHLSTMTHDGVTTVWGKNASNQVYYVSCPSSQLNVPGAWSVPVPLLIGAERMSPYINRTDGGNTIFASGGNQMQRLIQATGTDAKLWSAAAIALDTGPAASPLSFNSYTTIITVVDDQKMPAVGVDVPISTASRTSVYINGLYYVLSQTPVTLVTDANGIVTVVEPINNSISGTVLAITCDGGTKPTTINPMDNAFAMMAALNTEDSLRSATIPTNVVAGGTQGTPSSTPLVPASTLSNDLDAVATAMSNLHTAYQSISPPQSTGASPATSAPETPATSSMTLAKRSNSSLVTKSSAMGNSSSTMPVVTHTRFLASTPLSATGFDIAIAAGDLFRWLKSSVESIVKIMKDVTSDAWHFMATIAGITYRAVLDSIDAIVGAVEWVFNAVKTDIEDLIRFLEFLFDWDDIKRTKDVICNVTTQWIQFQVDGLATAKTAIDGGIASLEDKINQWASITDWSSSIGEIATQPASTGANDPTAGQTSGSQMMANHYKSQGSNLTIVGDSPTPDLVQQAITDLLNALEQEGQVLSATTSQLQSLATNVTSMTIDQILQKLVAILADTALSSVQVVVDAVFNILIDLTSTAITLLETKIHIPIISDILSNIGIPEISFLDLLCWIPAVAYTVVYNITNNKAPFSDSTDIQSLIAANSWGSVQAVLQQSQAPSQATTATMSLAVSDTSSSGDAYSTASDIQKSLYVAGFEISGFMSLMSAFVSSFEASIPVDPGTSNPWSIPSAAVAIIGAAAGAMADIAVPRDELQDPQLRNIHVAMNVVAVSNKIAFSSIGQKLLKAYNPEGPPIVKDGRATGAIIDMSCLIVTAGTTVGHLAELGRDGVATDKSAAVVGEVANLTSYMSRVAYTVAVTDDDPETKAIAIGVLAASKGLTGGLTMAQGLIE